MTALFCQARCTNLDEGVVILIVLLDVLNDINPVAERILDRDKACAIVGQVRGHVDGKMRGCFC